MSHFCLLKYKFAYNKRYDARLPQFHSPLWVRRVASSLPPCILRIHVQRNCSPFRNWPTPCQIHEDKIAEHSIASARLLDARRKSLLFQGNEPEAGCVLTGKRRAAASATGDNWNGESQRMRPGRVPVRLEEERPYASKICGEETCICLARVYCRSRKLKPRGEVYNRRAIGCAPQRR